jgi:hypothetical protein
MPPKLPAPDLGTAEHAGPKSIIAADDEPEFIECDAAGFGDDDEADDEPPDELPHAAAATAMPMATTGTAS